MQSVKTLLGQEKNKKKRSALNKETKKTILNVKNQSFVHNL